MYAHFGPRLFPLYLGRPLAKILKDTDLYLQKHQTWSCLRHLMQLKGLQTLSSVQEAVDADLFPTTDAIEMMEIQLSQSYLTGDRRPTSGFSSNPSSRTHSAVSSSRRMPHIIDAAPVIDSWNKDFDALALTSSPAKDHIARNTAAVHSRSLSNSQTITKPPTYKLASPGPVFMYGSQKLNSTEATRIALQRDLRDQDPAPGMQHLYSTSKTYQSLAFPLVDPDESLKIEEQAARRKWRTQQGFIVPPRVPTPPLETSMFAPIEAIDRKPLTAETHTPFPWEHRHRDFNLSSR